MTMAQTPLLGDENTPLHVGPGGGTGFEGATPRHQVAFTPNPLATPAHIGSASDVSATPRLAGVSATPLRTPMRDNLSINAPDGFSTIGDTPREQRGIRGALKASFMSLPRPENNFELLVPEEEVEEDLVEGQLLSAEDAADRDARLERIQEEEERKALARRSKVVQLGLPRPPNVYADQALEALNELNDDDELGQARLLINSETVLLMLHDSIAYPLPGTSHPGGTMSSFEMPDDVDMASATSEIRHEIAAALGFPNANEEQAREGVLAIVKSEEIDDSTSWASVRQQLVFDVTNRVWREPSDLSQEERNLGYTALLDESRDAMSKEASKASKSEKKLGVTLGGYQARSKALSTRISDAFQELQKTQFDYASFSRLRINEEATGPRRVSALKEEVERLERREKGLQERYAELESERRESEGRVTVLEEKVMLEAEALNEAALAEMQEP
jgi:pre-mRNA-splicing factor CDC5/CEF1